MPTFRVLVLTLALIAASAASHAEPSSPRPAGLPSDKNVAVFHSRAEMAILARLAKATPLAEGYFQRFKPAGNLGYTIAGDCYFLGRFSFSPRPVLDNLLSARATSPESAPAISSSGSACSKASRS